MGNKNHYSAFDYIFNSSNKHRRCGKVLFDWKTVINGEIIGDYPPSIVDIVADKKII